MTVVFETATSAALWTAHIHRTSAGVRLGRFEKSPSQILGGRLLGVLRPMSDTSTSA